MRIGHGYDVHKLVEGRPLILGGVTIPFEKGLLGHSDADVLLHAVSDALLGAAALGDIGHLFPDTDDRWKGADSLKLLEEVVRVWPTRVIKLRTLTLRFWRSGQSWRRIYMKCVATLPMPAGWI